MQTFVVASHAFCNTVGHSSARTKGCKAVQAFKFTSFPLSYYSCARVGVCTRVQYAFVVYIM